MSAVWTSGENQLEIFDFFCEDWSEANPYNTSFKVRVRSCGESPLNGTYREVFVGQGLWACGIRTFRNFIARLEEMDRFHTDLAELVDIGYGGSLRFELDRMGHVRVSGTLFGLHATQSLNFAFVGDQTALRPFLDSLRELLSQAGAPHIDSQRDHSNCL